MVYELNQYLICEGNWVLMKISPSKIKLNMLLQVFIQLGNMSMKRVNTDLCTETSVTLHSPWAR